MLNQSNDFQLRYVRLIDLNEDNWDLAVWSKSKGLYDNKTVLLGAGKQLEVYVLPKKKGKGWFARVNGEPVFDSGRSFKSNLAVRKFLRTVYFPNLFAPAYHSLVPTNAQGQLSFLCTRI
jgi:hypothetical protein